MARPQDTKVGFLECAWSEPFLQQLGGDIPPRPRWMVAPLGLEEEWQHREDESQGLGLRLSGLESHQLCCPLQTPLGTQATALVTQVGP